MRKDITSVRGTIDFLKREKAILEVTKEVDPIYEIAGILKAFEGTPPVLFENIKGYPGVRNIGNLLANTEVMAKIFNVDNPRKLKFKCLQGFRNPIPPEMAENAPCQEVVNVETIDAPAILPLIKYSERDAGHIDGGGITFLSGKYFRNGTDISFHRKYFRGKDWASVMTVPGTHLWRVVGEEFREEEVPLTINYNPSPAVQLVAGCVKGHAVVPPNIDELGIAGGIQGSPIEIVKAKTVDAYAIANSEWVIEGTINGGKWVWETEEGEKLDQSGVLPFFPEWDGYLGRVRKAFRLKVTAITHRKDRPIFHTPLARSFEGYMGSPLREALMYEWAERVWPGFVIDVNMPPAMSPWAAGIIFQVRKEKASKEGLQKNLLLGALAQPWCPTLVIVVDEDIDIYSSDDILFALTTRFNVATDVVRSGSGAITSIAFLHTESGAEIYQPEAVGIDATVPFKRKPDFERASYPSPRIDLKKWFSQVQIDEMSKWQCEYAKVLARTGW